MTQASPQAGQTTLAALKFQSPAPQPREIVRAGFDTADGFALMQRGATLLANSTIVPAQYRAIIEKKDKYGNIKERLDNPSAMSNCVVALNMATRMGADPLMIMQNLYIVEGRPAWSSQYIIASINACGKYSPLRFQMEDQGVKEVEYVETSWRDNTPVKTVKKVKVHDFKCIAWAIEKKTGEKLESPAVSVEMAVKEGWHGKNGSKWQTMPEVMLRYRAASFFGKLYAPELLMGIQTTEEINDSTYDMEPSDGGYQITTDEIRPSASAPAAASMSGEVNPPDAAPSLQGATAPASGGIVTPAASEPEPAKKTPQKRAPAQAAPTPAQATPQQQPAPQGHAEALSHDPHTGELFGPDTSSGYMITCPNSEKLVDERDCIFKSCHNGCPQFFM